MRFPFPMARLRADLRPATFPRPENRIETIDIAKLNVLLFESLNAVRKDFSVLVSLFDLEFRDGNSHQSVVVTDAQQFW
jgi:hypothetical protein